MTISSKLTRLITAIERNENNAAMSLINELGVDFVAEGGTALNYAALYDNLEVAKFCIDNKANVNALYSSTKVKSYTPLMAACKNGNLEIVKLLLANNADINLKDKTGFNALEIACNNFKMPKIKDAKAIIKILLDKGADPLEPYFDNLTYLEYNRKNDNAELAEFIDSII